MRRFFDLRSSRPADYQNNERGRRLGVTLGAEYRQPAARPLSYLIGVLARLRVQTPLSWQ